MTDLFRPGDERAEGIFAEERFLAAMAEVEQAWLGGLVAAGIARIAVPPGAGSAAELVRPEDAAVIGAAAEASGTPVPALLALLRDRTAGTPAAEWWHRGLTSQDVVDTALVLCAREALDRLAAELAAQAGSLRALADRHRGTLMCGRTLGQAAVPITFGLKAATWLEAVLDAAEALAHARSGLRAQAGGAAGTLSAATELAVREGLDDPSGRACRAAGEAARLLGLPAAPPWHTARAPVTRTGDALVACTDAWGRIANDVITLSRTEIGELREPAAAGRGGSSTMPQKRNPVLSVLVRRAALTAPGLGAQLHLAAADAGDERPAGAWQSEWAALRTLARDAVTAGAQTTEVLAGLEVDVDAMARHVQAAMPDLLAEQRSIRPAGPEAGPAGYLGTADRTIDAVLRRSEQLS